VCHRQVEHVGPTSLKTDPAFAPLSDQVVTRVGEVHELQLPAKVQPMPESTGPCSSLTLCGIHIASQVQQLLGMLDFVNIDVASFGMPLQCLGLGDFENHLAFTMFAPVVLAAAILLGFLSHPYLAAIRALDRRWFRRGKPKERLLAALPWLLILTFLVAPMVSSSAFRAFSCVDFDNGYTRSLPYSVPCALHSALHFAHVPTIVG